MEAFAEIAAGTMVSTLLAVPGGVARCARAVTCKNPVTVLLLLDRAPCVLAGRIWNLLGGAPL
jgi:hypothetical protein